MRPPAAVLAALLLTISAPVAAAQAPRDDPDSPDYLNEQRPQVRRPQSQTHERSPQMLGQSPESQGPGRGRAARPDLPKPKAKIIPEPRAILAIGDVINELSFDRAGHLLAVAVGTQERGWQGPGNAQVWDLDDSPPRRVATVPGHMSPIIQSVAFSPTEDLLAVGDDSGGLVLWESNTQANRAAVDVDWRDGLPNRRSPGTGAVRGLTFSPDGKSVAFLPSLAGRIRVHDAIDGRETRYWKTGEGYEVVALAFDQGHPLALTIHEPNRFERPEHDGAVDFDLFDIERRGGHITFGFREPISQAILSAGGRRLAYLAPRNFMTGRIKHRRVTIDGVRGDKSRQVYDSPSDPTGLVFDRAGDRLAVVVGDRVVILDEKTARPLDECRASDLTLGPVAFSPDGGTLAVAADREVILWDVSRMRPVIAPAAPPAGSIPGPM